MKDFFYAIRRLVLPVLAAAFLLPACSGYKDIRVDSCRLESISPSGFKAVDAGFSMQVSNPVKELVFSDIAGTVYFDGEELGNFEAPDVTVPGKFMLITHLPPTSLICSGAF